MRCIHVFFNLCEWHCVTCALLYYWVHDSDFNRHYSLMHQVEK